MQRMFRFNRFAGRSSAATLTFAALLLAGCQDVAAPPTNPSTAPRVVRAHAGRSTRIVNMMDACDPTSFNAVLGAGACTRTGGVAFAKFLEQVGRHGGLGAWHFAPPRMSARVGQTLLAVNRGGEVHTFTHVAAFGGGIVPLLNTLSGNTTVAPECTQLDEDDFVPPGGTYEEDIDEAGTQRFQCCIHPWMRTTAHVSR